MALFSHNPIMTSMALPSPAPEKSSISDLQSLAQGHDISGAPQMMQQLIAQNALSDPNVLAARAALEFHLVQSLANSAAATQSILHVLAQGQAKPCQGYATLGMVPNPQAMVLAQSLGASSVSNPRLLLPAPSSLMPLHGQEMNVMALPGAFTAPFMPAMRTSSSESTETTLATHSAVATLSNIASPTGSEEPGAKRKAVDAISPSDSKMRRTDGLSWAAAPRGFAPSAASPPRRSGASGQCIHGRQRSRCKDCGGSGICAHNKRRSMCKDCGGSQICEHGRQRSQCKDCGGASICEHKCLRSRCKECGGSSICEHGKRWRQCRLCCRAEVCVHKKRKALCKDCAPLAQPASA